MYIFLRNKKKEEKVRSGRKNGPKKRKNRSTGYPQKPEYFKKQRMANSVNAAEVRQLMHRL